MLHKQNISIKCENSGCNIKTSCKECKLAVFDPDKNCSECLKPGYDADKSCLECLKPEYDPGQNCSECLKSRYDPKFSCIQCLPGYDLEKHCGECLAGYSTTSNCTGCIENSLWNGMFQSGSDWYSIRFTIPFSESLCTQISSESRSVDPSRIMYFRDFSLVLNLLSLFEIGPQSLCK